MSEHKDREANEADDWQRALIMVMHQLGIVEILVKPETMQEMADRPPQKQPMAMVVQQEDGVHVIVTTKEALEPSRIERVN